MKKRPTSRLRSRAVTAVAIAAASMLALGGCAVGNGGASTANGEPELSKKPVTISLYWWGAGARVTSTEAAVKLFETKHPNITVKLQSADWGSYWDKLATTVAGGNAPDVMQFDQLYVASYAQRGAIADLNAYSKYLSTSDLSKNVRDTGEYKGKLYAVPIGLNSMGVAVNRTLLDKYDVKLSDTKSWTWDDLNRVAKEITKKSDGHVRGLDPFGGDTPSLTLWARQHGNQLFDQKGKVVLKPSVLASYWQYALDQIKDGITPSASQLAEGATGNLDQSDLATGKVAMAFLPSNLTAFQVAAPTQKLDMLPFPASSSAKKGWQYLKSSMYWAISSKSAHPAEAAELVDFLTTNTKVGALFGAERGMPANPQFQKVIAPDLVPSDKIVMNYIKQVTAESGPPAPITPVGGQDADTLLNKIWQNVEFGKVTPNAGATEYISKLKKALAAAQ
jgi:multiple sugar transport system substrate-binding protein